MSRNPTLKVDFCDIDAARYAVEHWHYSKSMPSGKVVKIGVWENDRFIGAVMFSRGATGHIGDPYNLPQTEICELTRVALDRHTASVSQIVAIALKLLKKANPGVRLVVSYADVDHGHTGGIYKAGGWIYEGLMNAGARGAFIVHGQRVHPKTIHSKYGLGAQSIKWLRANVDPNASEFITAGKHKYLMPLDDAMRAIIETRRKPYPKAVVV
jgi:hypothetical protein